MDPRFDRILLLILVVVFAVVGLTVLVNYRKEPYLGTQAAQPYPVVQQQPQASKEAARAADPYDANLMQEPRP